jgi:flavin-dependent dehydrogenase
VRQNGQVSTPFYFFQHYDHPSNVTWQVVRSDFDRILLETARDRGAEVRQGWRVGEIVQEDGRVVGVRGVGPGGDPFEFRAPITLDATGRDALSVARNGWRIGDPYLKKIAIWTYYRGAARDSGLDEAATTIAYLPQKGWFWYIPLPNDIVGVGVVAERDYLFRDTRDLEIVFQRERKKNAWIDRRLDVGTQFGRYYVTSEFSYRSRYCAADGLVLIGDAFAFLDPVFSSGLFLALKSGEMAADTVHEALKAGDTSASRFEQYGRELCRAFEVMRCMIYAFYDHDFSFKQMFERYPNLRPDLTDCLIGHLFRDFTELFRATGEFVRLPEPLEYGRPLTPEACASST